LFRIIHALTLKHANKAEKIRLRNKWVSVDPRTWARRTDLQISVGLGSGNSEQMFGKLMAMVPMMQQAQAMGLAGPQEAYNLGAELWKAAGFKNPDKFLHPPQIDQQTGQPQQPPQKPDPMVMAAQEQSKGLAQKAQIDQQTAIQKAQIDAQATMHKINTDAETRLKETYIQEASKMLIAAADKQLEERRMALDHQQAMADAQMSQLQDVAAKVAGVDVGPLMDAIGRVVQLVQAPRELVRDKTGKPVGSRIRMQQ